MVIIPITSLQIINRVMQHAGITTKPIDLYNREHTPLRFGMMSVSVC